MSTHDQLCNTMAGYFKRSSDTSSTASDVPGYSKRSSDTSSIISGVPDDAFRLAVGNMTYPPTDEYPPVINDVSAHMYDPGVFVTKSTTDKSRRTPRIGEIWRHCNGKDYRIVAVSTEHATSRTLVTYQSLYPDYSYWTRALDDFMGSADHNKYPNSIYRFIRISDDTSTGGATR